MSAEMSFGTTLLLEEGTYLENSRLLLFSQMDSIAKIKSVDGFRSTIVTKSD